MAAASDIGESDPGSGCDVIGVSIPPIVGVSTFWGDAVVGNDSSRLKRRSRLLVSGLFVATGLGAFFGLSSSDDESEDSDSDSELLSSVSDFSFFFFFAASDPGFGAGLAFVSAFLASTETSGSRSDLTDFEGSTFFGTSSSSSDPELDPEPELLLLLLLLQQRKQNERIKHFFTK